MLLKYIDNLIEESNALLTAGKFVFNHGIDNVLTPVAKGVDHMITPVKPWIEKNPLKTVGIGVGMSMPTLSYVDKKINDHDYEKALVDPGYYSGHKLHRVLEKHYKYYSPGSSESKELDNRIYKKYGWR